MWSKDIKWYQKQSKIKQELKKYLLKKVDQLKNASF
jgi:hypothetical protein